MGIRPTNIQLVEMTAQGITPAYISGVSPPRQSKPWLRLQMAFVTPQGDSGATSMHCLALASTLRVMQHRGKLEMATICNPSSLQGQELKLAGLPTPTSQRQGKPVWRSAMSISPLHHPADDGVHGSWIPSEQKWASFQPNPCVATELTVSRPSSGAVDQGVFVELLS